MRNHSGAVGVIALSVVAALALPLGDASAGSKPSGSISADPAEIRKIVSGKSWTWESENGGAYLATNGSFSAIAKSAVGLGTWSINRSGTLCYNATFHWQDNGVQNRKFKNCWRHVVDKDGAIWRRSHNRDNWFKVRPKHHPSGNRFGSRINSMKRKLGL